MPAPACPPEFIALANRLADASGEVLRKYFRTPVQVDDKPDQSPVTIADQESESAIRALIEQSFPDHGIFGEEHGKKKLDSKYVWVIDPIDGTRAFITGKPSFGTLLALLEDGKPILGVIDQPILRERWVGAVRQPTTLNGKPVRCRVCRNIDRASLYATAPDMFPPGDDAAFAKVAKTVKLARYGADCYAYALLATGFVDLVIEATLQPYDYLPVVPVIEGAGGIVTDWCGKPLGLGSDGRVVAAGDAKAHEQAIALLGAKKSC